MHSDNNDIDEKEDDDFSIEDSESESDSDGLTPDVKFNKKGIMTHINNMKLDNTSGHFYVVLQPTKIDYFAAKNLAHKAFQELEDDIRHDSKILAFKNLEKVKTKFAKFQNEYNEKHEIKIEVCDSSSSDAF